MKARLTKIAVGPLTSETHTLAAPDLTVTDGRYATRSHTKAALKHPAIPHYPRHHSRTWLVLRPKLHRERPLKPRAMKVLLSNPSGEPLAPDQLTISMPDLIATDSRCLIEFRADTVLGNPIRAAIADRNRIGGLPAIAGVAARLAQ